MNKKKAKEAERIRLQNRTFDEIVFDNFAEVLKEAKLQFAKTSEVIYPPNHFYCRSRVFKGVLK